MVVPDPPHIDRRKQIIAGIVTIATLAFVFLGVFPKFANYSEAWESMQQMSIAALVVLGIVTVLNIVVYVFPYQAAMPGLPYKDAFVVRQTSFMISNAIPAGGAFGLGVQYSMLSGYGYAPAATSTAIGATSLWNLLVTLSLPVVGVLLLVFNGGASQAETIGAVIGLVVVAAMIGALVLVLRSESAAIRLGHIGDRIMGGLMRRFRRGDAGKTTTTAIGADAQQVERRETGEVTAALLKFRDTLRVVVEDRWVLLTVTSVAQQLCQFLILAVAFYGIAGSDGGINPAELFAAFSLARLAGFIPITPGGLGTVDAALVALMVSSGADESVALAANLLWRAASFVPQVVLGIITFLVWRGQAARRGFRKGPAASVEQPTNPAQEH